MPPLSFPSSLPHSSRTGLTLKDSCIDEILRHEMLAVSSQACSQNVPTTACHLDDMVMTDGIVQRWAR